MNDIKYLSEYKTRINGISVMFKDVPYVEKWGSKVIKINFHSKDLENQICLSLLKHRPVLTGGVLKFIRNYLNWSLQDMANTFEVTKTTIADWESSLDKVVKGSAENYNKVFHKLLSSYQARILEDLLIKQDNGKDVYSDENPLDLRNEEESYRELAIG